MNTRPLFEQVLGLLDFANDIASKITTDEHDKNSYFMTLVYVEDILDIYGRMLIMRSASESGVSEAGISDLSRSANERLNKLRGQIRQFSQQYDFDDVLKSKGESMYRDWPNYLTIIHPPNRAYNRCS
ncbi:MAG TPA: hypothetical protein VLH84_00315 [Patescibacteria group bacterium]|nr:hypothetical protein [Patescibacteria group bacterium]